MAITFRFVVRRNSLRSIAAMATRIALVVLAVQVGSAAAALISIDFNAKDAEPPFTESATMSGDVAGVGTTFTGQVGPWNRLVVGTDTDDGACCLTNNTNTGPISTSPLITGNGTPTLAVFSLGTNASIPSPLTYGVFNGFSGSTPLRGDMVVLSSGAFAGIPGPIAWKISGLVPGSSYDLVLFGQQFLNAPFNPSTFKIFGNGPTQFDAENDGNFLNIIADGTGSILGTMENTGVSAWSGLQIQGEFVVLVPEPSTLGLLSMGIIGLAAKARRRRAA